jgi:hypothetical protein
MSSLWLQRGLLTPNLSSVSNTVGTQGLSAVGQQLPAIIGAFTLLRVLWLLFKESHEVID